MEYGIGKRIKKRRTDLGLTQSELADRMGYKSKAAICKVENGEDNITSDRISKFADALECSPAYLMGWEERIKELYRQTESLTDFGKTHEIDYGRIIKAMVEKYGEKDVSRAIMFARHFLSASPERQKIALEILRQPHQDGF